MLHDFSIGGALLKLVETHHADIGHTISHGFGDIIISQEQHLHGELARGNQQRAAGGTYLDSGFLEQFHGVLIQTTLGLHCNTEFHHFSYL